MSDLERLIVEAAAEGVGKSSMLASSLAARIVSTPELMAKVIETIDKETLAKAIAYEIVKGGTLNKRANQAGYNQILKMITERTAEIVAEDMAEELRTI